MFQRNTDGAGNGNRTRVVCLGSRSVTIAPYLRKWILQQVILYIPCGKMSMELMTKMQKLCIMDRKLRLHSQKGGVDGYTGL